MRPRIFPERVDAGSERAVTRARLSKKEGRKKKKKVGMIDRLTA